MAVQQELKSLKTSDYKDITIVETLKRLDSSANGLPEKEAEYRLKIFGHNDSKIVVTCLFKATSGKHNIA